jgi:tetratricopeptide (TPR) repeat protein
LGIIPTNKGTRVIILVMVVLALAGLAIAWIYYSGINRSSDPRVRDARTMYGRFNVYAATNEDEKILSLLDSIYQVFKSVDHYSNSYEIGVVMNNRATIYLTRAISDTLVDEVKLQYLAMAERELNQGIEYYQEWINTFEALDESGIHDMVYKDFMADPVIANDKRAGLYIRQRVNDIMTARAEMPRRLSVSYTNMGIIRRHENRPEEAVEYYVKALELWEDNLAAKNNLNIIFGRPVEKHGLLRRLFPPRRSP